MIMLKVVAVVLLGILGTVTLGCACLGALYFVDCMKEYEEESKYFLNDN